MTALALGSDGNGLALIGVLLAPIAGPVIYCCTRRTVRAWRRRTRAARLFRTETCTCDAWWTSFGRRHSAWCPTHPIRRHPS